MASSVGHQCCWPPLMLLVLALCGGACSGGAVGTAASPAPPAPALPRPGEPEARAPLEVDYLMLVSQDYSAALAPLVRHREQQGHAVRLWTVEEIYDRYSEGRPEAMALYAAIQDAWTRSSGQLRFVLLVGDIRRQDETSVQRLPAFYLPKLDYNTSHAHRIRHFRHRSLLHPPGSHFHGYPTDHPYALMDVKFREPFAEEGSPIPPLDAAPSIAVGRVPARAPSEVSGFVDKVIRYERADPGGSWSRRLVVFAGPANFGQMADSVIERSAMRLLDQQVPYDYDVSVTFAKPDSPYTYRLDRITHKLVADANAGALFLLYVGHSSPAYFDRVQYRGDWFPLGARQEFEGMNIPVGPPLFLSLSCGIGAFDLSKGWRSIAEAAVMNPKGPIASFAASRESHPYPNLLLGEAFIDHFLQQRPRTIGEGLLAVKRDFLQRVNLMAELLVPDDTNRIKQEHLALYNLFGDPATTLRYPAPVRVRLGGATTAVARPSSEVLVTLASPVHTGTARVTLETERRVIRHRLVPFAEFDEMPLDEAFQRMAENHAKATDKVVIERTVTVVKGRAELRLSAPADSGHYVLKVLVIGKDRGAPSAAQAAAGFARLQVRPATADRP